MNKSKKPTRWLVRTLAVSVVSSSVVLGVSSAAHACSCVMPRPVATAPHYDAVFVGVTGEEGPGSALSREVEVTSIYRGRPGGEVVVKTGQGSEGGLVNSCDFLLPADKRLVFFVDSSGETWQANPCNQPLRPTEKLLAGLEQQLGTPHEPHDLTANPVDPDATSGPATSDEGDTVAWLIGGAVLLGAAGAGAAAYHHRRRTT
jgi:hypothetical protein